MLNGKEFGRAIGVAINRKLDAGLVASKAEIARHFKMQPPSLSDWVKKGSVAKAKLPELWRYFSDVAGPEHWGMTQGEWPTELSTCAAPNQAQQQGVISTRPKTRREQHIDEILALLQTIDIEGLAVVLRETELMAKRYPLAKQTPSLSQ